MNIELEKCGWCSFLIGTAGVFLFTFVGMVLMVDVSKVLIFLSACLFAKSKGRSAWWGLSLIVVALLRDRNVVFEAGKGYRLAAYIALISTVTQLSLAGFLLVVMYWDSIRFYGLSAIICIVVLFALVVYFLRCLNRYLIYIFKV